MPTDRELDQLIDAALPSYSAAEPQTGFEQRILHRAFAEPRPKPNFVWAWALAVPAIACLLIFFVLPGRRTLPRSSPSTRSTADMGTTAPALPEANAGANIGARTPPSVRQKSAQIRPLMAPHPAASEPLPKQDIFPSPSPLTAEEQTLLAYDRAQLRATKTTPAGESEINPIRITELDIKPLAIPSLDLSANGQSDQQP